MPDTYTAGNRSIIGVMRAVIETGSTDKLCEDSWVFTGTYPEITYDSAKLEDENLSARLARVKKALELEKDADAKTVIEKLAKNAAYSRQRER